MSALDLDALERRCKDTIAEWTLVYAQSGETLPDDAVETKAARETLALITRLRAAEARIERVGARLAAGDWSANRSHDWSEVNGRRCARCHVRRTDEGASAFCTQQGAWTAAAEKEHGG